MQAVPVNSYVTDSATTKTSAILYTEFFSLSTSSAVQCTAVTFSALKSLQSKLKRDFPHSHCKLLHKKGLSKLHSYILKCIGIF